MVLARLPCDASHHATKPEDRESGWSALLLPRKTLPVRSTLETRTKISDPTSMLSRRLRNRMADELASSTAVQSSTALGSDTLRKVVDALGCNSFLSIAIDGDPTLTSGRGLCLYSSSPPLPEVSSCMPLPLSPPQPGGILRAFLAGGGCRPRCRPLLPRPLLPPPASPPPLPVVLLPPPRPFFSLPPAAVSLSLD